MTRCESCSCPVGQICASINHPRYCELVKRDRERLAKDPNYHAPYLNFIAGNPVQPKPVPPVRTKSQAQEPKSTIPSRPRFLPERGKPKGVVQVWPMASVGGAERAMISIMKATSPGTLWRGVGVLEMDFNDPAMMEELQALGPVAVGPDECKALIASAQVVVAWAVHDIASMLPESEPRPKIIAVSHSQADSAWAMRMGEQTIGIDQWVAVSDSAREPIPEAERNSAVIIPNAIDPRRLKQRRSRERIRREWGISPHAKVLGCYHRQSSEKDPTALARAIAYLPEEWVGVSIGSGFETEAVKVHASVITGDRVKILPADLDAGSVFGGFDALLVSSKYESFCLTMAEAFAYGLPVISTPVGIALEYPNLVRQIPVADHGQGIAAAVIEDDNEPDEKRERVAKAKAIAQELWYPDQLGRSWSRLLAGMLDGKVPADMLAKSCVHRGCKTGCQHFICNRESREVHKKDCIPCVRAIGA